MVADRRRPLVPAPWARCRSAWPRSPRRLLSLELLEGPPSCQADSGAEMTVAATAVSMRPPSCAASTEAAPKPASPGSRRSNADALGSHRRDGLRLALTYAPRRAGARRRRFPASGSAAPSLASLRTRSPTRRAWRSPPPRARARRPTTRSRRSYPVRVVSGPPLRLGWLRVPRSGGVAGVAQARGGPGPRGWRAPLRVPERAALLQPRRRSGAAPPCRRGRRDPLQHAQACGGAARLVQDPARLDGRGTGDDGQARAAASRSSRWIPRPGWC